jgi:hypothetical protein
MEGGSHFQFVEQDFSNLLLKYKKEKAEREREREREREVREWKSV